MESCELCGFEWERVPAESIRPRTLSVVSSIAHLLRTEGENERRRPSEHRWSSLEYAAHVRDVVLTIRDRTVIGLVEENPSFKPMYRDERVDLGLYGFDSAGAVSSELETVALMFLRLFESIEPSKLSRTVQYGFPDPIQRTLLWMAQQVVHESEHHYGDMVENARLLEVTR